MARKEAVVKALGTGFHVDPRHVVTGVAGRARRAVAVALPPDVDPGCPVMLRDLPLPGGRAGAVATCGPMPASLRHGVLPRG
jgi:hypothetical protein